MYSALSFEQSSDDSLEKSEILVSRGPNLYGVWTTQGSFVEQIVCFPTSRKQSDKLKQLVLLEEFKKCVLTRIKAYLEDHKVNEL